MLQKTNKKGFQLALVESLLQLKTLDSYSGNNKNNIHLFVRLNGEQKNEEEILNFIKPRACHYSSVQFVSIRRNDKFSLLFNILKLRLFLFCKRKVILIIGDPRALWMNMISSFKNVHDVIYLEDGMSTVLFYQTFKPKYPHKHYKLVTRLKLDGNAFLSLIPLEVKKNTVMRIDNDVALFIGMPMIENNALSKKKYLSYLHKIIMSLKNMKITKFYYAPHRYENENNFYLYENLGFHMLHTDCAIEDYLNSKNIIPAVYASFYSTALLQIDTLFYGVSVICYVINVEELNYDFRNPALYAYEYYNKTPSIIKVDLHD
ncbi:TPA: hypothetical protein ACP7ST_000270 [Escherichia coli]|uniref:hypothetical protein n=1 Tax=Escherichia coli TaxID=562 RepID=UPI00132FABD8|nr:hypothetical protein [Escherichia coli]MCE3656004.1 hypothetical protein [Escherichia coli]HAO3411836.1 hypothetical protein [Escherichia coli]HCA7197552.1 hypothetical protein [Escherichia coli]HCJ5670659.1 hypothetical protein [Escherichia coli]HCJ8431891.1 hypothetical protein [Escherichia coli]